MAETKKKKRRRWCWLPDAAEREKRKGLSHINALKGEKKEGGATAVSFSSH